MSLTGAGAPAERSEPIPHQPSRPLPPPLPRVLGRGAVAGAVAGIVTSVFSLLLAEPVIDRAVLLESRHDDAAVAGSTGATGATGHHAGNASHGAADAHGAVEQHAEVFGRGVQHLGLVVSTVAAGVALGVLFAVVYALVHRRDVGSRPWERSLRLAGAALVGVWLLPFVRYPADPPGAGTAGAGTAGAGTAGAGTAGAGTAGDTGTLTAFWLGAMAIGGCTVVVAWWLAGRLRETAPPLRQGALTAVVLAGAGLLFLLPDDPDAVSTPAELLWDFRLVSAASSVLLWTSLGAAFGLLGLRATRPPRSARG